MLVYTFRTFPWIEQLKNIFPEVIIFGKLNEDFEKFCEEITRVQPELILGVAKGRRSAWEGKAINKFNQRKIIKEGMEEYNLYIPEKPLFPVNQNTRSTFCNWTAYRISDFVTKYNLETKRSLLHINKNDIQKLAGI